MKMQKEDMEICKEAKRNIKRFMYQSKEEVHEQFGRRMNQDVNANRKLFWEELSTRKSICKLIFILHF